MQLTIVRIIRLEVEENEVKYEIETTCLKVKFCYLIKECDAFFSLLIALIICLLASGKYSDYNLDDDIFFSWLEFVPI